MENIAIDIKNLKYKYTKSKKEAIKIADLSINEDQLIGLIGANGSGKTTLMKLISCILNDNNGAITVLGGDARFDNSVRKEIIYSMPDVEVSKLDTPAKLIKYFALAYPNFDKEFALKMFEMFDIQSKKLICKMSQGQKSVVHFTCALATRAKITLLDEPFTAIDIAKRKLLYEILLRDYMENPRTIIVSSHNLDELEASLSEILLINDSEVVFYEDIDTVREMLFRADGNIEGFKDEKEVVSYSDGELGHYLIAKGSVNCELATKMKDSGCKISSVAPSDVCVQLTSGIDKKEVDALWS